MSIRSNLGTTRIIKVFNARIQKTNNGNVLDLDVFLILASYLTPKEIGRLRSVCLRWRKIFSSKAIWRPLFLHYFDPDCSDDTVNELLFYFEKSGCDCYR